jgi:hypothetical protein
MAILLLLLRSPIIALGIVHVLLIREEEEEVGYIYSRRITEAGIATPPASINGP